jgi:gliding motility-associated-like protein
MIWMAPLVGWGQAAVNLCNDATQPGSFTVTPQEGCAPLSVSVQNTFPGATSINWDYDYSSGLSNNLTTLTTHTYSKAGNYTLLQVASGLAGSIGLCKTIKVLDTTPPTATPTACTNGKVQLAIQNDAIAQQYDRIEVDWGDGTPKQFIEKGQPLDLTHSYTRSTTQARIRVRGLYATGACGGGATWELPPVNLSHNQLTGVTISRVETQANGTVVLTYSGISGAQSQVLVKAGAGAYAPIGPTATGTGTRTLPFSGLNPTETYTFRIRTSDACEEVQESTEASTTLLTVKAENNRNELQWPEYPMLDFTHYRILRDGVDISQRMTQRGTKNFIDDKVQCGVTYRYQLIVQTSTAVTLSAPIQVTAVSNSKPSPVDQALVSVEQDGSVALTAIPPTPERGGTTSYRMIIQRAESNTSIYREIKVLTNTNRFTDLTSQTSERSYCYRIIYESACGIRSDPSEPICTILLERTRTTLKWTTDKPFTEPVNNYGIFNITNAGLSGIADVGTNNSFDTQLDNNKEKELNYQVRAQSQSGFLSYSNVIKLTRATSLFFPDAFSPNGDGRNDVFEVKGAFLNSFQMLIYNRWGEVVFKSDRAEEGWDGTINGTPAPAGSYMYRAEIRDDTGVPFVKTGTLLLMR